MRKKRSFDQSIDWLYKSKWIQLLRACRQNKLKHLFRLGDNFNYRHEKKALQISEPTKRHWMGRESRLDVFGVVFELRLMKGSVEMRPIESISGHYSDVVLKPHMSYTLIPTMPWRFFVVATLFFWQIPKQLTMRVKSAKKAHKLKSMLLI